ncbi:nucleotide sugar dehydrogenase [Candidatus Microgenomates bacterium]|nr:nucleotide sugar dehydrogenase [Candidatus Microgenomates bacterium]
MKNVRNKPAVGILGLWHLGLVYAVSLAKSGYRVTGFDMDKKTIENLKNNRSVIAEPGLEENIKKYAGDLLFFSNDPSETIRNKKYIFICLDIPVDNHDRVNLKPFIRLFNLALRYSSPNSTIVISSQIPVGTSRQLRNQLKAKDQTLELIYFPENLRLGKGLKTFLHPQRIVLGTNNEKTANQFRQDFPFFNCPVLVMSLESAEMAKHALNSFLALNISFASEIADLCEISGANIQDVIAALKSDARISPQAPINPGLGFAGGTLGRDIQSLVKISDKYHYQPSLLQAAYKVNKNRLDYLLRKIKNIMPNLPQKQIGILGLTYKPGTNTLRRSISLELVKQLHKKKAKIKAYDPSIKTTLSAYPYLTICRSYNDFFRNLDLAILMTDWPQFKKINLQEAKSLMKKRAIIDTKNFLDYKNFISLGFKYHPIGFQV